VVSIIREGILLGQVNACGLAADDEEPDAFLGAMQVGISEEEVDELARSTPPGSEEELRRLGTRLFAELNPTQD
jgi:hypothetical protein